MGPIIYELQGVAGYRTVIVIILEEHSQFIQSEPSKSADIFSPYPY